MDELTTDDVRNWDLSVINQLFRAAKGVQGEHEKFGESLDNARARTNWHGEAGDAFGAELGKQRKDIEADGKESQRVAAAVENAENDITNCKTKLADLDDRARENGWTNTSDWRVDDTNANDIGRTHDPELLQNDLNQLKTQAHTADHELGVAIRAVVGDTDLDTQGHEVPDQRGPAGGKTTPAHQLPLPTAGQTPSPTEATAGRHDHPELGGPDYLAPYPNPSPLIAGLSAEEWRQRLAHFKPGDPLPDPRTPTGDKAIDALAYASGQQNTTYAWGGNKSNAGPSKGQGDNGDGANQFHDWDRYGYDCGGLVRYSVQQGAGIDVGMGTNNIDGTAPLAHLDNGAGISPRALPSVARPGDILVFETPGSGHQPFSGTGTQHTGIYIGNGFMMNAPQSGEPVGIADASRDSRRIDVLRINP